MITPSSNYQIYIVAFQYSIIIPASIYQTYRGIHHFPVSTCENKILDLFHLPLTFQISMIISLSNYQIYIVAFQYSIIIPSSIYQIYVVAFQYSMIIPSSIYQTNNYPFNHIYQIYIVAFQYWNCSIIIPSSIYQTYRGIRPFPVSTCGGLWREVCGDVAWCLSVYLPLAELRGISTVRTW